MACSSRATTGGCAPRSGPRDHRGAQADVHRQAAGLHLEDAREIARLAKEPWRCWFSTSTLRYAVTGLKTPDLSGVEVWGQAPSRNIITSISLNAIHGRRKCCSRFSGTGCEEVTRVESADTSVVACRWKDGRIGTMRALRPYADYGAVVFRKTEKNQTSEIHAIRSSPSGSIMSLVKFFVSGTPPVPNAETLELMAFLDAAQRSKEARRSADAAQVVSDSYMPSGLLAALNACSQAARTASR